MEYIRVFEDEGPKFTVAQTEDTINAIDNSEILDTERWIAQARRKFVEERGYLSGPMLDETINLMAINRQLNSEYRRALRINKSPLDILKAIRDNSKQIVDNVEALDAQRRAAETTDDIATLHRRTMDDAESYIKEHIGEFTWGCPSCGQVITTGGIPHWALIKVDGQWAVWSEEMAIDVSAGNLPLHRMAYYLRTSIEAIMVTAEAKGFSWEKRISKVAEEEALRSLMLA